MKINVCIPKLIYYMMTCTHSSGLSYCYNACPVAGCPQDGSKDCTYGGRSAQEFWYTSVFIV